MCIVPVVSVVALAILVAAAAEPVDHSTGKAIQVAKRSTLQNSDHTINAPALVSHVASIKYKILRGFHNYEENTGLKHPIAANWAEKPGASESLAEAHKMVWFGNISVGTPAKDFIINFDTGSSDLIIPASTCSLNCNGQTLYDPDSSSTSKKLNKTFSAGFGNGSSVVAGDVYTDNVAILDYKATNQTLGAANSHTSDFSKSVLHADGLLGMAFQTISSLNASPVFETLVSEGQICKPEFSFKLASSGSELYLGGSNHALYKEPIAYTPVTRKAYWEVVMEDVSANGRSFFKNLTAVVDTGTSLILGPPKQIAELYGSIGDTPAPEHGDGVYTLACDSMPNVTLSFGGQPFRISHATLNTGKTAPNSSICISGIVAVGFRIPIWVIGDVFLQNVYTIFDVGRGQVGFAELS